MTFFSLSGDKCCIGHFHGLTLSPVGNRSIASGFEPQLGYVRRMFHLSVHLITFGCRSAYLTYHTQVATKQKHLVYIFLKLGCIQCCWYIIGIENPPLHQIESRNYLYQWDVSPSLITQANCPCIAKARLNI